MKVFICTLGTSIANDYHHEFGELAQLQRKLQQCCDPWDASYPEFEKALDQKLTRLKNEDLRNASAELTILSKGGGAFGAKVVLLCSDGYLGRACGEAVKRSIVKLFGLSDADVEIVRVADLQVHDGELLSRHGIRNFVNEARKAIEKYAGNEICLCPNGGYKGVVPFLTLLGMQYHCQVVYTFEFANSMVKLPPLPFVFDRKLYLRARRALAALTEKVEMHENEYLSAIDGYDESERELFLGFVEYTRPGFVTPSPLVDSFVSASEIKEAWLSRQALEDLAREKNGNDYFKFCRYLLDVQDPIWRGGCMHTFHETDLIAVKKVHSALRVLGFLRNGRFYVARLSRHDEYDRIISKQKIADFPESCFTRWTPPAELDEAGSNLSTESELQAKNDALWSDNQRLKKNVEECECRQLEADEKCENLEAELCAVKTELAQQRGERTAMETELAAVKSELAAAQAKLALPWYRRLFVK